MLYAEAGLQEFLAWGHIPGSSSGSYRVEADEACRGLDLDNALT